jgi:hypothetical protein
MELHSRPTEPGDIARLNCCLQAWNAHRVDEGDQPPIGLLLGHDPDQPRLDYVTGERSPKVFESRCRPSLPSLPQWQQFLESGLALETQETLA